MHSLKRLRMSSDLRCFFRRKIKPAQRYVLTLVNVVSIECEPKRKFSRSDMNSIVADRSRIFKCGEGEHTKIECFLKWLDDRVFLHLIMAAEKFRSFKFLHENKVGKTYRHLPYLKNRIAAIKTGAFLVGHGPKNDLARKRYGGRLARTVNV